MSEMRVGETSSFTILEFDHDSSSYHLRIMTNPLYEKDWESKEEILEKLVRMITYSTYKKMKDRIEQRISP